MHEIETIETIFGATDERCEFFTKPARENMLSTGTEDALNIK